MGEDLNVYFEPVGTSYALLLTCNGCRLHLSVKSMRQ